MRITTNFVFSTGKLIKVLTAVVWLNALVFSAVALGLLVDAVATQDEVRTLKGQLAALEAELSTKKLKQAIPPLAELNDLKARVTAVNAINMGRGGAVSDLLIHIEKILPAGAYLVTFQHQQLSGEVAIGVQAEETKTLMDFLSALEDGASFTDVLLVKQSDKQVRGKSRAQFDIRFRESGHVS